MILSRKILSGRLVLAFALLFTSATINATPSWAATPVSSIISLEAFTQVCADAACAVIVDQETASDFDGQTTTLDPLLVTIVSESGSQLTGPGANASLTVNAAFASVSSGSIGFAGETGIRRPSGGTPGSCTALNSLSDGFSYTFVASTDGFLTINYNIECAPISSTSALGNLEIHVDGTFWASAVVTAASPTANGTLQRPIQEGATHTFRIKPNLNAVSGNACGAPPAESWECEGGATWSFDVAPPTPVPSPAGSWSGSLFVIGCLASVGAFGIRRRTMNQAS